MANLMSDIASATVISMREAKFKVFGSEELRKEDEESVTGKVVVITGGQRGIGKASAMELARRGAVVVLGCVDMDEAGKAVQEIKAKTKNPNIEALYLDLSDMDKVQNFALEVSRRYPKIKIIINNAGLGGIRAPWAKQKTREGFNLHVAVNHLGHFLLTNLLLENLKKEEHARVLSITSNLQLFSQLDLDDLMMDKSGFGSFDALPYCNTKFANSLFIKELGERLKTTGIRTYAVCPSTVNTQINDNNLGGMKMHSKMFGISPEQAASRFVMYCALSKKIRNETGFMYSLNEHFEKVNKRLTPELCGKLWDISSRLVHLNQRIQRHENEVQSAGQKG